MTPKQLAVDAAEALQAGTRMVLVMPRGRKGPKNFPRGKLVCETPDGRNVYSFDAARVLKWLEDNNLSVTNA